MVQEHVHAHVFRGLKQFALVLSKIIHMAAGPGRWIPRRCRPIRQAFYGPRMGTDETESGQAN